MLDVCLGTLFKKFSGGTEAIKGPFLQLRWRSSANLSPPKRGYARKACCA